MDFFQPESVSSARRLNSFEGIHFDGRTYTLYDPNFKIHDTLTINFQIQTFSRDGLILWVEDSLPESSFTIEIQNRQLVARAVVRGLPFSVRTDFTKDRLCNGVWHCIQVRLDGSLLTMKVDKRQYTNTEPRISSVDMRGPLFIGGFSKNYSPPYLSVRTKDFFFGNLRSLRINEKQVDWLTPKSTGFVSSTPEFHRYRSGILTDKTRPFTRSPAPVNRTVETTTHVITTNTPSNTEFSINRPYLSTSVNISRRADVTS